MPSTLTVTDPPLLRSIQPDSPLIGSAPGASPDGLDAGPVLSASNHEIRCVLSLLLA